MTEPAFLTGHLSTYRSAVLPDWVDYNGHLRDAYYLLLFSLATDALMDQLGLDEAGRAATGHSLYTLECHLNFVQEVKLGQQVEVRTQILGHDTKRLHLNHSLHRSGEAPMLAASVVLPVCRAPMMATTGKSASRSVICLACSGRSIMTKTLP